jgi:23S rRNA-/tRNA-specific pseudouridylate synthase
MEISKSDSFVYYQDKDFYYFWKPAGLASTRWKSVSFLDLMSDKNLNKNVRDIVDSQMEFFWKEKELWLLNRLDWPTTWLLYFAKNLKVYNNFRELQQWWKIDKFYVAEVYGNIQEWINRSGNVINYPIMHHRYNGDRMVVIRTEKDKAKW